MATNVGGKPSEAAKEALKELEKLRKEKKVGPPVINFDIPLPYSGAQEAPKPVEETKPAAERVELPDDVREKLFCAFIDDFRAHGKVEFNSLLHSLGGRDMSDIIAGVDKRGPLVKLFLAQLEGAGDIRYIRAAYEFTEKGITKYADRILSEGSHERLLANFIDLLRAGRDVDTEALAKTSLGRPGEVATFLAKTLEMGEMEKDETGKYRFTTAALDKYADRIFWYPVFRLTSNPFVTFDAGTEHRADLCMSRVPVNCVPMVGRVQSFISARASAIIEGERGCGKTSIIACFEASGNATTSISPRSVGKIKDAIRERVASKIGPDGKKITVIAEYSGMGALTPEQYGAYKVAMDEVGRGGHLFDVPDNLSHKAAFELADLCARILDEGGFVILFATPEQARMLRRLDTFARFPVIKFERPGDDFFIELFSNRVKQAQSLEAPLPIEKEAILKIAKIADHNPRRFIILCSHLLTEMRERGMGKPIDEKTADELLKDKDVLAEAPIDITEALRAIMRECGAKWVKVREIRTALIERYGIDLRPETIGRRLTEMSYPRRYAPDAEYLAQG